MARAVSLLATVIVFFLGARADSPLTTTPFFSAYTSINADPNTANLVAHVLRTGQLRDEKLFRHISDPYTDLGGKLAIVNALGYRPWRLDGRHAEFLPFGLTQPVNAFVSYLTEQVTQRSQGQKSDHMEGDKHQAFLHQVTFWNNPDFHQKLRADEAATLGYLVALNNFDAPEMALPLLQAAENKKPNSFAIRMLLALVRAQRHYLDGKASNKIGLGPNAEWSVIYGEFVVLTEHHKFRIDFLPAAFSAVLHSISDYKHEYEEGESLRNHITQQLQHIVTEYRCRRTFN
jgi:hypothetical protein